MDVAKVPVALAHLRRSEVPITEPVAKIGGTPVFIEPAEWPTCPACGRPMEFITQLLLQGPLPLSRHFAMAYVFQCVVGYMLDGEPEIGFCPGDPQRGGTASAVLLQHRLGSPYMPQPAQAPSSSYPEYAITFTHSDEPDVDLHDIPDDDVDEFWEQLHHITKLGGIPKFIQDGWATMPCPACGTDALFIAQIDADLDQKGYPFGTLLRFGDVGRAYLWLCSAECSPQGYVYWWDCH